MLFIILLVAQVIICLSMGSLILIQRSEGGALGMGGGPSGFMSARGTGNLLTALTGWFAVAFFVCSIALTVVGNMQNHTTSAVDKVDANSLPTTPQDQAARDAAAAAAAAGASSSSASSFQLPISGLPLAGGTPTASSTPPAAAIPTGHPAAAPVMQPTLPAKLPAKLPALGSASVSTSSPTADQIARAKASVFRTASSSVSAPAAKPASSAASTSSAIKPVVSTPAPASPASSTSPQ